jgi:hypothetical protein
LSDQELANLTASSPLAWIVLNKMVNENQKTLEFNNHRFMIDFYADDAEDIVSRKSAQVGFSVAAILKSIHHAKYRGQNIIYVLPTRDVVDGFVVPKVNPLITSNPAIHQIVGDDSKSLKRIGDRFIYFRGAFNDRQAINISGDVLVLDEYDRMPDMNVVNTFDSRLQAAEDPKRWRFSNPSGVGFGVDALYTDSNQLHWFVKCTKCNHNWYIDWEKDDGCHYVNRETKEYACGKCDAPLSDSDRRNGEWVAKYPTRDRRGYWFSQLMAPWVTAKRVIDQWEESNNEFFYNFVLGKAYTSSDMIVDRAAILRATSPSNIEKRNVVIGVDQDAGGQYYVCLTPDGVFDHGYVDSWDKIEHMKLMYNAIVVCDPNPYGVTPKQMAAKYNDWYLCYFKESTSMESVKWDNQVVYADRTRVIDIVSNEIINGKILFRQRASQLEDTMIKHWLNIYRTTVEKEDGRIKSTWLKKEGKQSDYPFALTYARIGLSKVLGGNSTLMEPDNRKSTILGDTGISRALRDTLDDLE